MNFVDTNIILRYLMADDPAKARACAALFKTAVERKQILWTTHLVMAEVIWVLEKFYKIPRTEIAEAVLKILNTTILEIEEKDVVMSAVGLYQLKKIDFIDAYHAMMMLEWGVHTLYSYDEDFDLIPALQRMEP